MMTQDPSRDPAVASRAPRPARRAAILAVAVLLAGGALAPTGSASHWTLYTTSLGPLGHLEPGPGHTLEPDGAVLHAPGHLLDGAMNHVHHDHEVPGGGGLLLDARVGQQIGVSTAAGLTLTAGMDFYAGRFTADLHGRSDVLFPGGVHVSAWYGLWSDLDGDGIIHDVHDGGGDPEDEFFWRGLADGKPTSMLYFQVPFDAHASFLANRTRDTPLPMLDRTGLDEAEQSWKLGQTRVVGEAGSLISAFQTVVVAGAPVAPDHPLGHDIDHVDALRDVDRYEVLSPDVETLYLALAAAVAQIRLEASDEVRRIQADVNAIRDEVLEPANGALDEYTGPVFWAVSTAISAPLNSRDIVIPPYPKEPNHPDDDFESRASYGGVGDHLGSRNTYPGYTGQWGFYLDNFWRHHACPGVRVLPEAGLNLASRNQCLGTAHTDPGGALFQGYSRSTGVVMTLEAHLVLWQDFNGDGHIGTVCDPDDPDEFDAETSTCRTGVPSPWPNRYPSDSLNHGESFGICAVSSARGGVARLVLLDGDWNGAILVRDVQHVATAAVPGSGRIEVLEGNGEVTLRFEESCQNTAAAYSRDAIIFPPESPRGAIRMTMEASIAGYTDVGAGIDVGSQGARDVDVIPGMM